MKEFILALLVEVSLPLMAIALPVLAGAIVGGVVKLAQFVGVTVSQAEQDTLHSALMTGLRAAVQKGLPAEMAVKHAVEWALGPGASDTVKKLQKKTGLTTADIADMARAKLDILQRGQVEDNKTAR
jgi:hypothetical protein